MFKREAEDIIAKYKIEDSSIEVQGRTLSVGEKKDASRGGPATFGSSTEEFEIVAFAEPQAHGYTDKWDDAKDCPAVIYRRTGVCHPSGEFEVCVAWDW